MIQNKSNSGIKRQIAQVFEILMINVVVLGCFVV